MPFLAILIVSLTFIFVFQQESSVHSRTIYCGVQNSLNEHHLLWDVSLIFRLEIGGDRRTIKCQQRSTYTFHFFSLTQFLIFQETPWPPWLTIAPNLINNRLAVDFVSEGNYLDLPLAVKWEQARSILIQAALLMHHGFYRGTSPVVECFQAHFNHSPLLMLHCQIQWHTFLSISGRFQQQPLVSLWQDFLCHLRQAKFGSHMEGISTLWTKSRKVNCRPIYCQCHLTYPIQCERINAILIIFYNLWRNWDTILMEFISHVVWNYMQARIAAVV